MENKSHRVKRAVSEVHLVAKAMFSNIQAESITKKWSSPDRSTTGTHHA